jgi:hypothetical protein
MAANTLIDELGKMSATKLQAIEEAIDMQIADLQTQKGLVTRVLIQKGVRAKPSASTPTAEKPRRSAKQRGKKTGSTATIKEIITAEPERVWMPAEVIAAAHERGVGSTAQAIRVALRRMGEQGFLERGPTGDGWILAKSNGSPQGSFDQEETSQASYPKALAARGQETVG